MKGKVGSHFDSAGERRVSTLRSIAGNVRRAALAALPAAVSAMLAAAPAGADIFVLASQGEVRGQLVNRDESPRKTYVIKTTSGGQVTLDAGQVVQVKPQSAAEMKYDRYLVDCPDTVEGHWTMAEWCRKNRLYPEREAQLKRIIELDPDHAEARRGLGFSQIGGRWVTQQQVMLENGYVKSKFAPGRWVLPQEEELLAARDKVTRARLAWNSKLKLWSGWLSSDKGAEAAANIKAISDPFAVSALAKYLETEDRRNVRMLYLGALSRIDAPAALDVLIGLSLNDADEEIRLSALEALVARRYEPAVAHYVQALKHPNNAIVNRAAVGLGALGNTTAIGPLIDALVTTHTFKIQKGQPGQTAASFGSGPGIGGGGFSFGGSGVQIVKRQFENQDVLQALVKLTEGTSFNYDVQAWKNWFVAQRKPTTLDARRD